MINTATRFQAWESVHGVLPWEGVFAAYNATAEELGSDPTSGNDPNRIRKNAFIEGYPNTTVVPGVKAASYMVEMAHKYPGQVSIFAAGAMTNIALAVRLDDEFASLAKELVIMGGYVDVNMYQVSIHVLSVPSSVIIVQHFADFFEGNWNHQPSRYKLGYQPYD